jgi:hypothetical protein
MRHDSPADTAAPHFAEACGAAGGEDEALQVMRTNDSRRMEALQPAAAALAASLGAAARAQTLVAQTQAADALAAFLEEAEAASAAAAAAATTADAREASSGAVAVPGALSLLPPGVRMPYFEADDLLPGMLAELHRCGWIGPERVSQATADTIAGLRDRDAARTGLCMFVQSVSTGQLGSQHWSAAALEACTHAKERTSAAAAPALAAQLFGDDGGVRGARSASPVSPRLMLPAAIAAHLGAGARMPLFRPSDELPAMLAELHAAGWMCALSDASDLGITVRHFYELRDYRSPSAAARALRRLPECLAVQPAGCSVGMLALMLAAQELKCEQREAFLESESRGRWQLEAAPQQHDKQRQRKRSRSRERSRSHRRNDGDGARHSRSRSRSAGRGTGRFDAPNDAAAMQRGSPARAAAPHAAEASTLQPGMRVPAFSPGDSLAGMLNELRNCGWIGIGRISGSTAEKLAGWRVPPAACAGLRTFVDIVVSGQPVHQSWGSAVVMCCAQATPRMNREAHQARATWRPDGGANADSSDAVCGGSISGGRSGPPPLSLQRIQSPALTALLPPGACMPHFTPVDGLPALLAALCVAGWVRPPAADQNGLGIAPHFLDQIRTFRSPGAAVRALRRLPECLAAQQSGCDAGSLAILLCKEELENEEHEACGAWLAARRQNDAQPARWFGAQRRRSRSRSRSRGRERRREGGRRSRSRGSDRRRRRSRSRARSRSRHRAGTRRNRSRSRGRRSERHAEPSGGASLLASLPEERQLASASVHVEPAPNAAVRVPPLVTPAPQPRAEPLQHAATPDAGAPSSSPPPPPPVVHRYFYRGPATGAAEGPFTLNAFAKWRDSGALATHVVATLRVWRSDADESGSHPLAELLLEAGLHSAVD